jgi:predicted ATPase
MSILKSARIEGLWDDRAVAIVFDPRVNFLIGANGSGKTTVLNLIASALSSDFEGLERSVFSFIECVLTPSTKGEPDITVSITRIADEAPPTYHYEIKVEGKPDIDFTLGSPRYYASAIVRRKTSLMFDSDSSPLRELVNVNWLPVHRAPVRIRSEDRTVSESSVDRRLTYLSNQLVRYFSKIATARDRENNRFLREMLTALVYSASEFDPFSQGDELSSVQRSIEKLMDVFLGNGADRAKKLLSEHFALANKAAAAARANEGLNIDDLIALAAVRPMQKIVQEWNESQAQLDRIARPRREFLEVINEMYKNKSLILNPKNELEVDLSRNKHLSLSELSSGEKQLLILFSEALLQEKREFIYIADEPELSLHVTWQEQLTRNLLKINPCAQVIFATHSPDIVSQYGDKTVDMETLFV